jgi:hypothetical protein
MCLVVPRRLAWALILALAASARAQIVDERAPEGSESTSTNETAERSQGIEATTPSPPDKKPAPAERSVLERVWAALSQEEDPDGPISTDRPTFTPANTVVPRGRLQFESGFTFNATRTATTHSNIYDLPELSMRYGLWKRVEFRTFWLGENWTQAQARRGASRPGPLPGALEVGFKWQLLEENKEPKWIPTTALITSVLAPTGGTSPFESSSVEPYVNLIYAWNLTDKLTLAGSTGYLEQKLRAGPGIAGRADSFERYHQSLVAFFSATKRTTLFYEWYVLMFTNASDDRPLHFMDGGLLYRLTPNMQLDLRAGFGLSGRPGDFFTGAGYSVRF